MKVLKSLHPQLIVSVPGTECLNAVSKHAANFIAQQLMRGDLMPDTWHF